MIAIAINNSIKVNARRVSMWQDYPTASWGAQKEKGNFEAEFRSGGKSISALFSSEGSLLESEQGINVSELPAPASSYIKSHYPGKVVKEAARISKADGKIEFEAEIGGRDLVFDAKGNFLEIEDD